MSQIVIISGPSGAGKSSAADALCERYDRTVHIETDAFFSWIKMGFINPMRPESDRQNRMIARAVSRAATAYAQELYAVFIDGVIGPHLLPIYLEELRPAGVPVHFVLLVPDVETALVRSGGRQPEHNMVAGEQRDLHQQFDRNAAFAGAIVDNTRLDANETADRIMELCGRGEALVLAP
jgi:chloramphenicol 3-O-phosphotransferase